MVFAYRREAGHRPAIQISPRFKKERFDGFALRQRRLSLRHRPPVQIVDIAGNGKKIDAVGLIVEDPLGRAFCGLAKDEWPFGFSLQAVLSVPDKTGIISPPVLPAPQK